MAMDEEFEVGTPGQEQFPAWIGEPPEILILEPNSQFAHMPINATSDIQDDDVDLYSLGEISGYGMGNGQADHFFPIHYACGNMAAKVYSFASNRITLPGSGGANNAIIRSKADLYLALETQFKIDAQRRPFSQGVFRLEWANESHGAAHFQRFVLTPVPANLHLGQPSHLTLLNKGWIRVLESKVFEADPQDLDLQEVTTFIASFLRRKPQPHTIEAESPEFQVLRHYINHDQLFPPELRNIIIEHLHPLEEGLQLQPIGVFTSEDWRNLLPCVTPWLWDLDLSRALPGTEQGEGEPAEWDWEPLLRMLAQIDAFEPGGCMQGAPLGLRNRRRIWRMLVEMKTPRGGWRT